MNTTGSGKPTLYFGMIFQTRGISMDTSCFRRYSMRAEQELAVCCFSGMDMLIV